MFTKIIVFLLAVVSLLGITEAVRAETMTGQQPVSFKAEVIEIIREEKKSDERGREVILQTVKLRGLSGEWKNKEVVYDGIDLGVEIAGREPYQKDDLVWVMKDTDLNGQSVYFITDYARTGKLYFLAFLFAVLVVLIGRWHGFKALVGLVITFVVLMQFMIPRIVAGDNPLLISIIGSLIILVTTLYLVHGFNSKTTVAVVSTLLSLLITGVLSMLFTYLTRLTGFADEESAYLVSMGQNILNIKGILLAGMVIGALGVLDDITVSQASVAEEIYRANPELSRLEIYKRAMKVGIDHVSSIVNTLVLAYAGASLPLLLLFNINRPLAGSVGAVLNNETIATEIVRTLVGSVGLVIAVPITSFIAAYFLKSRIIRPSLGASTPHCH